jgi:hypothetical protein
LQTQGICHGDCHFGAGGLLKQHAYWLAGRLKNAGQALVDLGRQGKPYFSRQVLIARARKALMAAVVTGHGDVMLIDA